MAKIYGALEVAQLEWFTDAGKPAPASYIYRVIYVSDLKQVQVSDGTNWIAFLNTSTNQTLAGDITFTGAQIFSGQHRLSVTTNSSTGAIVALAATTPVIEFTGAVTSIAGIASGASGATVMLVNRSGNSFQILDEGSGASASNRIRTGAGSITVANNASVLLTYVGDNRWHVVGGSGSGAGAGGAKNYYTLSSANANFAQNTVSPWSAATLTLSGSVPTGAPTLTATQMAIATTATNPMLTSESLYNMQLTKSAANAQGQGFISSVLTIDREDVAKVLTGTFSYEVVSGTIDLSGASTQSLEIWVYNVTANQWIQPAGFRGMNQSSGVGQVTFTFQTDGTPANVQYRVAVITAQTSTSAYVVNFNDFKIGPQTVPIVQLRNPAGTIIATGSLTPPSGYLYCDGTAVSRTDYAELFAAIGTTYGVGNGTTTFNIPDLRGIFARGAGTNPSNASNTTTMGNRQLDDFKSHTHGYWSVQNGIGAGAGASGYTVTITATTPTTATGGTETRPSNVGVAYHICFSSGFVQTSNDTDTRVVAFSAYDGASVAVTNTTSLLPMGTSEVDTHAVRSGNTYVVPVSGFYRLAAKSTTRFSVGNTSFNHALLFYKNNILQNNGDYGNADGANNAGVEFFFLSINSIVRLNAGDVIDFRYFTNYTGVATTYLKYCSIERLSGPSVIAASETVAARYGSSSGQSMTNGTDTLIDFSTRFFDTHNSVTTGASWRFTAPISGKYRISSSSVINTGVLPSQATAINIKLYKNNALSVSMGRFDSTGTGNGFPGMVGVCLIDLVAGDFIDIRLNQATGANRSLTPQSTENFVEIFREGN